VFFREFAHWQLSISYEIAQTDVLFSVVHYFACADREARLFSLNNAEQRMEVDVAPTYKAAKNKGREGWCVLFRHPVRPDKDGKPARVRRGLGTRDESEADSLVAEMNRLLSDDTLWTPGARSRASRDFDERIVSAFYGPLEAKLEDSFAIRQDSLRLPTLDEGYTKVLLVGTTGAGKTTVARQIIGTDPERERFPSTATARTTIFDTEVILAPGAFRAVVSFRSQDRTRLYIDECVTAAVAAAAAGDSDAVVLRRLLEHSDLRFRLNYVLGGVRGAHASDDDLDDGEEIKEPEADGISEEEREQNERRVMGLLERVRGLAQTAVANLEADFQLGVHARAADRDALLELVEDAIRDNPDAQELVDDILDEVQERFALVEAGDFERETGWPKRWEFKSEDRLHFIKTVNQFSSNYAPRFGRLLTPLVSGIRVMGPFRPNWAPDSEVPRLVLLDTEGIGHTPESAMSIPTAVTKKYELVDAILLVDNATQPLQAGAQAVLRSVIAGGHESKLATVFTHFEQVVGDNLPDAAAKKGHVLASFESTLRTLEEQLGANFVKGVRKRLETRVFFTAGINGVLPERARATRHNLNGLLEALQARPEVVAVDAVPVYDMANLVLAARGATQEFHDIWHARVGLGAKAGVSAEHWARVKALTRRYAQQIEDHYGNLQPVADLIKLMAERLARFVSTPREWKPVNAPEDARQAAIDRVARELYTRLHDLAGQRLFQDHVTEWMRAYAHRGAGSSRLRAIDVRGVYELAAPVPGETPAKESVDFLDALRKMFRDAAETAGAETV